MANTRPYIMPDGSGKRLSEYLKDNSLERQTRRSSSKGSERKWEAHSGHNGNADPDVQQLLAVGRGRGVWPWLESFTGQQTGVWTRLLLFSDAIILLAISENTSRFLGTYLCKGKSPIPSVLAGKRRRWLGDLVLRKMAGKSFHMLCTIISAEHPIAHCKGGATCPSGLPRGVSCLRQIAFVISQVLTSYLVLHPKGSLTADAMEALFQPVPFGEVRVSWLEQISSPENAALWDMFRSIDPDKQSKVLLVCDILQYSTISAIHSNASSSLGNTCCPL